ncbi:OsmC family protein [Leptospira sp. 2 VSF19]|uniref:OsmC family protein n=1 Tax=Leptospira soteropolitanensis TaxID=2950025 RepID=A0AAW5VMW4_9LEPT|nr:OsmC family protein [Leptospira soteropolitanensis]MCW7492584.1 OsmC family protein [Leptospira soteropolitanensis]MCW7500267.1 OsmC family protein [Leptospira soteropolitanensis]MCW7522698.1 OsmC family protein [Leptospira soteropolitanensis]MCW7526554.1 OsmC family protein [Leptospira soteropolitanensis]MCW7530237.1 OsmC family protein [Leptospira soteropolitanensis]
MHIKLSRIETPYVLEATNESGNSIRIDASPEIGGKNSGPRPMELLIMGLAGCSSIDVLMILTKHRIEVLDYSVDVDAEREKVEEANLFKNIYMKFKVKGGFKEEQVKRAIDLSLEKYCSVAKTLEKTAKITYEFELVP